MHKPLYSIHTKAVYKILTTLPDKRFDQSYSVSLHKLPGNHRVYRQTIRCIIKYIRDRATNPHEDKSIKAISCKIFLADVFSLSSRNQVSIFCSSR